MEESGSDVGDGEELSPTNILSTADDIDDNTNVLDDIKENSEIADIAPIALETNVKSTEKRGIKRPLTSFILFLSEKREAVARENPEMNFREIPKFISEMYKALNPEEREHYENLAKKDKERYHREVEEYRKLGIPIPSNNTPRSNETALILPLARMKRMVKLDSEVKNVSKEALVSITKATELFIGYLCLRASQVTQKRKAKTIKDTDLFQSIHTVEKLSFLRLDFPYKLETTLTKHSPRTPSIGHIESTSTKGNKGKQSHMDDKDIGSTSIKSFFQSSTTNTTSSSTIEADIRSDMVTNDETVDHLISSHLDDEDPFHVTELHDEYSMDPHKSLSDYEHGTSTTMEIQSSNPLHDSYHENPSIHDDIITHLHTESTMSDSTHDESAYYI